MKPSDETKRFWLMLYAREGFHRVVAACNVITEQNLNEFDPAYDRCITTIVTNYGRAWRNNRGVGKLDEGIVPEAHLALHGHLLEQRDKVYAHKDADGPQSDIGKVNQIRLLRRKTGFIWVCGNIISFQREQIPAVRRLCMQLEEKLDAATTEYENKCRSDIEALPEGEYILNLDVTSPALFMKTDSIFQEVQSLRLTPCAYEPRRSV
ncbi:MAG: hypothetical protein R6V05_06105 [Candidatus Brocadiia bacterium]